MKITSQELLPLLKEQGEMKHGKQLLCSEQ
jgi:hypothetical protein